METVELTSPSHFDCFQSICHFTNSMNSTLFQTFLIGFLGVSFVFTDTNSSILDEIQRVKLQNDELYEMLSRIQYNQIFTGQMFSVRISTRCDIIENNQTVNGN